MSICLSDLRRMIEIILIKIENLNFESIKLIAYVSFDNLCLTELSFFADVEKISEVLSNYYEIVKDEEKKKECIEPMVIITLLRFPLFITNMEIMFNNFEVEFDFEENIMYLDFGNLPVLTIQLPYEVMCYLRNKLKQIAWNWLKMITSSR